MAQKQRPSLAVIDTTFPRLFIQRQGWSES